MRMNSGQLQINYNCAPYLLDANVYATCLPYQLIRKTGVFSLILLPPRGLKNLLLQILIVVLTVDY